MKAEPGSDLAAARTAAHRAFDHMWQGGAMSRSEAYAWLAQQLRLHGSACHIIKFDIATCRHVVELCNMEDFKPTGA
jgi:hypothetical protein